MQFLHGRKKVVPLNHTHERYPYAMMGINSIKRILREKFLLCSGRLNEYCITPGGLRSDVSHANVLLEKRGEDNHCPP